MSSSQVPEEINNHGWILLLDFSLLSANSSAEGDKKAVSSSGGAGQSDEDAAQTVRFASANQEIEPSHSLQSDSQASDNPAMSPKAEEEIRNLALNLHKSRIQQKRMTSFAFEPVSLPASRVQSNEPTPQNATREQSKSDELSPKASTSTVPTPPLTPSGTQARDTKASEGVGPIAGQNRAEPTRITPQTSGPKSSSDAKSTPMMSDSQESLSTEDPNKKKSTGFSIGPSGSSSSLPGSREQSHSRGGSPSGGKGSETDVSEPPHHAASYPRLPPPSERDDPYARSKRPPQSKNLDAIENRFVFGKGDPRRRSGINIGSSGSSSPIPRSSSGTDLKNEHRQSTFSLHGLGSSRKDSGSGLSEEKHHGSMSELKRFFFGGHHKNKRSHSPSTSIKAAATSSSSGTRTPPHQSPASSVPFADDHGLVTKYGKFGKMLGSGAGGSVRLMKRSSDGVTFAVKQFRERHTYETEKDYNKKVTAEFCIGSTLHHGNIIETLDIIHEGGRWYEVMEYAPYDLFAIVMTGKMSREEVNCCFLQIVAGVTFLHGMGLAHRDLKLDNVVVNSEGIMKLIDFGSAVVFRYPFENDIILASGVVGSDPYLAPEVYDNTKYDPQPADVWSLGIIYACMALRRFPWKAPRLTDNSFKLFAATPSPGTPGAPELPKDRARSTGQIAPPNQDDRRASEPVHHSSSQGSSHHHHHHHHHESSAGSEQTGSVAEQVGSKPEQPKSDTIKGPWRLLRLLPRETRVIVGRMLEINPKARATLEEILADSWVKASPVCEQLEGGTVVHHGTHTHTLEPGSSSQAPTK